MSARGGLSSRTAWDPALSPQGKTPRARLPGHAQPEDQALTFGLLPAPEGPLFAERLILWLSDGQGGRWMMNLGEFKQAAGRARGALAQSKGYIRIEDDAVAWRVGDQIARWLGHSPKLVSGEPGLVPFDCHYHGLMAQAQPGAPRWEVFTLELGTAFALKLGLRLWREGGLAQLFVEEASAAQREALLWILSHMIWGTRLAQRHEALRQAPELVRSLHKLRGPPPDCEVLLHEETLWMLGCGEDEQPQLWRTQPGQLKAELRWRDERALIAASLSGQGVALVALWDEAAQATSLHLLRLEEEPSLGPALALPPELDPALLEPGALTLALRQDAGAFALHSSAKAPARAQSAEATASSAWLCDVQGRLLGQTPEIPGLEAVIDWAARGVQLVASQAQGGSVSWLYDEASGQLRGGCAGQAWSPDGRVVAKAHDLAIRFEGAHAWSWPCRVLRDLEALSSAGVTPVESLRWRGPALVLYSEPWLLLDPERRVERVLAWPQRPEVTLYECAALSQRRAVMVDLDGELWLAQLDEEDDVRSPSQAES